MCEPVICETSPPRLRRLSVQGAVVQRIRKSRVRHLAVRPAFPTLGAEMNCIGRLRAGDLRSYLIGELLELIRSHRAILTTRKKGQTRVWKGTQFRYERKG